ncbi:STM2901 family protein [Pseudenterobacter timonensis]|uniref:STM2901 family protein n=1 Tax=Pseudenterobacter timonensis TaxID=1755099 RepID=A0ABV4ABU7_9ENTR
MDTTEELNGTYFYHGHANVTSQELFLLIFVESLADHIGVSVETAVTILTGLPLIPKRKVLGASGSRTSIASKLARRMLKDARFPGGMRVETIIGIGKVRSTNKIGTVIGRAVPYVGYAQATIIFAIVARKARNKYNLIARPKDQIAWTSF